MSNQNKTIVQIGNPILRLESKPVKNIESEKVKDLIKNMTNQMRTNDLIGITAPQVEVNLRLFITEIRATALRKNLKDTHGLRVYINPKLGFSVKKKSVLYEGCGSLVNAQLFGPVRRPKTVTTEALDEHSNRFNFKADGLLARCIQHEHDHVEGILCIDKFLDLRKIGSVT